jgi:hypothetical protein
MNTLAKYFIKGELIEAMAQTYIDLQNNKSMYVNPDLNRVGNEYFKFCNDASWSKATKMCRISFRSPAYVIHTNSRKVSDWTLNAKEKKYLVRVLNSKSDDTTLTVWQALIVDYNKERYSLPASVTKQLTRQKQQELSEGVITDLVDRMIHALPIDLPMPNYLKLR